MFTSGFNKIFGADPKLEFRRPGSGVFRLTGVTISPTDSYWVQYWLLFDSPLEVITLIDSQTLSIALEKNPENLITLINVLSNHLFDLLASPSFPGTSGINWNPTGNNADLGREALNCVRVLSRVIPFIFQNQLDNAESLEELIFWTREKTEVQNPVVEAEQGVTESSQFVIDDEEEEEEEEEAKPTSSISEPLKSRFIELPPLADRLLSTLVDLLFVAGFTLPEECKDDGAVSYIIWEPGIAALDSQAPPVPQFLLSARLEILRLLNILLALPSLLSSPQSYPTLPNRWRNSLVSGITLEKKVVLCLLCSVLNTALAGGRPASLQPSGVISGLAGGLGLGGALDLASGALDLASGAAGKLGEVVMRREDIKGLLVGSCLQLLAIIFIEHAPPESTPTVNNLSQTNLFAYYLSKLHRASDFDFLISGIFSLLVIPTPAPLSVVGVPFPPIISNSGSKSGFITEALVILWRMLELNGKFLNYLLETDRGGELLVSLLTFCLEFKDDDALLGLVRLSAFLIQTLTADKALGSKVNVPVELKSSLRAKYNVPGSIADFLIVSIYTLVFTTKARLSSLYPAFILTITNCSAYFKNLSVVSSTRLLQLFLAFSAPSFLLMEEGNPRLVFYLLETFNNVVHYQLNSNPNLIYSLIRSSHRFEDLSSFTLSTAVAEVRKQRLEKKSTASGSIPSSTTVSAVNSPKVSSQVSSPQLEDAPEMEKEKEMHAEETDTAEDEVHSSEVAGELSEKARGKLRESSNSGLISQLEGIPLSELSIGNPLRVEELERSNNMEVQEESAVFVGKNGFIPTEGWVSSWRDGLPLDSLLILVSEIRPEVLSLTSSLPTSTSSSSAPPSIKTFLETVSVASNLPTAPNIHSRKFITSPSSLSWIASLIYGSIYVTSLQLLREVNVQLFGIERAESRGLNINLGLREVGNTSRELLGFVLKKVGI